MKLKKMKKILFQRISRINFFTLKLLYPHPYLYLRTRAYASSMITNKTGINLIKKF